MSFKAIDDFGLERYFARWEFAVRHQLSASDVEPFTLGELLALADDDARARWASLSLGYTESAGLPALREAIAATYARVSPDGVLVLAGAEEGIFLLAHAALGAGDDAIVVTPAYQSLLSVPRAIGARVIEIPLRRADGWRLDIDAVASAVTPRTRLIVVNFPHNPTGAHIGADEQRRLVEIADDAGALLLSDEVYRGLEYAPADALPSAADLSPRVVSLGVMSKSYALAGLRIGWLACRDSSVPARVARLKDYTTICSSAPSEVLALMALRARERVLERSRAIVAANLAHAHRFFSGRADVRWVPPRAGSVAFPWFAEHDASTLSPALAERESVLLLPGGLFDRDPHHFRLGLGRRDFPDALRGFERFLTAASV